MTKNIDKNFRLILLAINIIFLVFCFHIIALDEFD